MNTWKHFYPLLVNIFKAKMAKWQPITITDPQVFGFKSTTLVVFINSIKNYVIDVTLKNLALRLFWETIRRWDNIKIWIWSIQGASVQVSKALSSLSMQMCLCTDYFTHLLLVWILNYYFIAINYNKPRKIPKLSCLNFS